MFERFSENAINVVNFARDEARRFGHESVRLEHVFLGLIMEPVGLAHDVLEEAGVTLNRARKEVAEMTERGQVVRVIPLDEETKRVMEGAVDYAQGIDNAFVSPEHILLSLLEHDESLVADICKHIELDVNSLRLRVLYLTIETATPTKSLTQRVGGLLAGGNRPNPYTEKAQQALKFGSDRAKIAGSKYVGTDHILLGIVSSDSPIATKLLLRGVSVSVVQNQIKQIAGPGFGKLVSEVTYTPMANRALAEAHKEAMRRKQPTDVAHILFGLMEEHSAVANQVLRNISVDQTKLLEELQEILDQVHV